MLPRSHPDRIQIAFDDHRLVANAGLMLPATLARRLGLPQLADRCLDLGHAPGRANTGDKLMTLVASALAGGDCIDDADASGGTAGVLGCVVKTLGTFLRSFRWGHVRQPGEPGVAGGPGLPGPVPATHHSPSPGLHHLRDLRPGQGGCPPPRLHPPAGLSPAAGRGRRHWRRADGPAAGWSFPAGDGEPGALRRGQGTAYDAGRQRLLYPSRGPGLPPAEGPLLHHRPPAPEPAQSHRGHTRGGLEAHILLDGRRGRRGRDGLYSLQD